jgi:glycerol-3-phosphate dehydrogenase
MVAAQVVWGVRHEMARTVDDMLSRRMRALPLNAKAAMDMATPVAQIMAAELKKDAAWAAAQTSAFRSLARTYLP